MQSLDINNFVNTTNGTTPCLIHFFTAWCGPCFTQEDILLSLEKDFPGVIFRKVNCEENPDIIADCDILAIPTIIFYKNGKPCKKLVGLQEIDVLKETIKSL